MTLGQRSLLGTTLRAVGAVLLLFAMIGPLSGLAIWSFAQKWFWPHLLPQEWGFKYWKPILGGDLLKALQTSVTVALLVTVITLVLALPLAYLLARFRSPLRSLVLLLFLLPQAFPQMPVFANTAVLLYKWDLAGRINGVVLIHMVGALVFAVWTLTAVIQSIPEALEEAAMTVGASRTRAFFSVTLPLALPGLIAGGLLVFLHSLDEFTGTLLVGAPFVNTMPVYMYQAAQGYEMQSASVAALLLMIPGILMLLGLERFLKAEYLAKFGGV